MIAGTIGKYNAQEKGQTGMKKRNGLVTFFWGEEIYLNR